MFARQEAGLGQWVVMFHRRGNHDCVKTDAIQHVVIVGQALDFGVQGLKVLQAAFVYVAHCFKRAGWQRPKIPNMVGTPISAPDHAH